MAAYDIFEELKRRMAEADKLGTVPDEKHSPGELYKVERIGGHTFHVYYGYVNGSVNEADIIPLYPDLIKEEVYVEEGEHIGWRIACSLNDACECYRARPGFFDDNTCMDCNYYTGGNSFMAICSCPCRHKRYADRMKG